MPHTYAYRWLTQAMVTIFGFGSGALGLALIAGGPQRFVASSFATARMVPGQQVTWGLLFLAGSALTLLGAWRRHNRLTRIGLFLVALGFLFLDISLIVTAVNDSKAPVTGAVIYAVVAAACLSVWGTAKELT
jgi:hypothetical protein